MKNLIRILGLSLCLAASASAQSNYAGIYFCDLSGDYYGDSGAVAVFVRTNNQATLVGSANGATNSIGLYAQFKLQNDGNWSFHTNGISASGQVFSDGTFTGGLNF